MPTPVVVVVTVGPFKKPCAGGSNWANVPTRHGERDVALLVTAEDEGTTNCSVVVATDVAVAGIVAVVVETPEAAVVVAAVVVAAAVGAGEVRGAHSPHKIGHDRRVTVAMPAPPTAVSGLHCRVPRLDATAAHAGWSWQRTVVVVVAVVNVGGCVCVDVDVDVDKMVVNKDAIVEVSAEDVVARKVALGVLVVGVAVLVAHLSSFGSLL